MDFGHASEKAFATFLDIAIYFVQQSDFTLRRERLVGQHLQRDLRVHRKIHLLLQLRVFWIIKDVLEARFGEFGSFVRLRSHPRVLRLSGGEAPGKQQESGKDATRPDGRRTEREPSWQRRSSPFHSHETSPDRCPMLAKYPPRTSSFRRAFRRVLCAVSPGPGYI